MKNVHSGAEKAQDGQRPVNERDLHGEASTKSASIAWVPLDSLESHPLIATVYVATHDTLLRESVALNGITTPLLMTAPGVVISGSERLWAAREAGLSEVPVIVIATTDTVELEQMVLASNVAREKTNEQRVREYQAYKRIEETRAKARKGVRTDLGAKLPPGEAGKSRDIAAAKVGWSGHTAEKGAAVVNAIQEHGEGGANMQIVEEIRTTLNENSPEAGYNKAMELGWVRGKKASPALGGVKPAVRIQAIFTKAKTAAAKLAEVVRCDEITQFTPKHIKELRTALSPVLQWVDGLDPVGKDSR